MSNQQYEKVKAQFEENSTFNNFLDRYAERINKYSSNITNVIVGTKILEEVPNLFPQIHERFKNLADEIYVDMLDSMGNQAYLPTFIKNIFYRRILRKLYMSLHEKLDTVTIGNPFYMNSLESYLRQERIIINQNEFETILKTQKLELITGTNRLNDLGQNFADLILEYENDNILNETYIRDLLLGLRDSTVIDLEVGNLLSHIKSRQNQIIEEVGERKRKKKRKSPEKNKYFNRIAAALAISSAAGIVGGIAALKSWNPQLFDAISSVLKGAAPQNIVFTDKQINDLEDFADDLDETAVAAVPTNKVLPTATPIKKDVSINTPTPQLPTYVPNTPTPPPTKVEPTATATIEPTAKPEEKVENIQNTYNAYEYLKGSMLNGLNNLENGDIANVQLLDAIDKLKNKFENDEALVINLVVTDRFHFTQPGEEPYDRSYWSEKNGDIGDSDGIIQLVVNPNGIYIFSIGRDSKVPYPSKYPQDGTYAISSYYQKASELAEPILLKDDPDPTKKVYMQNAKGEVVSYLSEGRMNTFFETMTGNSADMNVQLSLGEINELFDSLFPKGLEVKINEGFYSEQFTMEPGEKYNLSGRQLLDGIRARKAGIVNSQGLREDLDTFNRGVEFLKRVLLKNPENVVEFTKKINFENFFKKLFSKDLGKDLRTSRQTIRVNFGSKEEKLQSYILLMLFKELSNDPEFNSNIIGLLGNAAVQQKLHLIAIQPPPEGYNGELVAFYNSQVKNILKTSNTYVSNTFTTSRELSYQNPLSQIVIRGSELFESKMANRKIPEHSPVVPGFDLTYEDVIRTTGPISLMHLGVITGDFLGQQTGTKEKFYHLGIDINQPGDVISPVDMEVVYIGDIYGIGHDYGLGKNGFIGKSLQPIKDANGKTIINNKGEDVYLYYVIGHMAKIDTLLKPGDRLKRGSYIGIAGSEGNATGTHVHFEIRAGSQNSLNSRNNLYMEFDKDVPALDPTYLFHTMPIEKGESAKQYNIWDGRNNVYIWFRSDESPLGKNNLSNETITFIINYLEKQKIYITRGRDVRPYTNKIKAAILLEKFIKYNRSNLAIRLRFAFNNNNRSVLSEWEDFYDSYSNENPDILNSLKVDLIETEYDNWSRFSYKVNNTSNGFSLFNINSFKNNFLEKNINNHSETYGNISITPEQLLSGIGKIVLIHRGSLGTEFLDPQKGFPGKFHQGIDIIGEGKVIAPAEMEVVHIGNIYGYSDFGGLGENGFIGKSRKPIVTLGGREFYAYYIIGHMKSISDNVKVGAILNPGDYIGEAGKKGNATGVHVHFEFILGPKDDVVMSNESGNTQLILINQYGTIVVDPKPIFYDGPQDGTSVDQGVAVTMNTADEN